MLNKMSHECVLAIRKVLKEFLELPLGTKIASGLCFYLGCGVEREMDDGSEYYAEILKFRDYAYHWCALRTKERTGRRIAYVSIPKEVNEGRREFATSLLKEVEEFIASQQTEEATSGCNHQEN